VVRVFLKKPKPLLIHSHPLFPKTLRKGQNCLNIDFKLTYKISFKLLLLPKTDFSGYNLRILLKGKTGKLLTNILPTNQLDKGTWFDSQVKISYVNEGSKLFPDKLT
jgi:hypothetical protein